MNSTPLLIVSAGHTVPALPTLGADPGFEVLRVDQLPDAGAMDTERPVVVLLHAALARDIRINGPDGKKMALNSWKWQDAQTWKDMLRAQLLISLATPNELGHLQQTVASAQAISPRPISHVQVSLPRAMNPILVRSSPTDAFWLTDQIPQAIVTYE